MASNYENEEAFYVDKEPLSSWNTWTNRSILKALSGIFLAFPVLAFAFYLTSPIYTVMPWELFTVNGLISFIIGLVLWVQFYRMEMVYRKVTPNRIR